MRRRRRTNNRCAATRGAGRSATRPAAGDGGFGHARGIGGDARDAVLDEQRVGVGVNQLAWRGSQTIGPSPMQRADRRRTRRDRGVEGEARRQLDQHRPAPVAELGGLLGERRDQLAAIDQPPLVRDRLGQLDREPEAVRHARRPARIGRGLVRAVEARIDLDRVEPRRVAFELLAPSPNRSATARGIDQPAVPMRIRTAARRSAPRSLGPISTTLPSASGKPSVSTSDMIGPIWRGGKLTTAATCRPTSSSSV